MKSSVTKAFRKRLERLGNFPLIALIKSLKLADIKIRGGVIHVVKH